MGRASNLPQLPRSPRLARIAGACRVWSTSGGAAGVGRATTNSVVLTMVLILTFDYILTTMILAVTGLD